jgi:hypothetical protein
MKAIYQTSLAERNDILLCYRVSRLSRDGIGTGTAVLPPMPPKLMNSTPLGAAGFNPYMHYASELLRSRVLPFHRNGYVVCATSTAVPETQFFSCKMQHEGGIFFLPKPEPMVVPSSACIARYRKAAPPQICQYIHVSPFSRRSPAGTKHKAGVVRLKCNGAASLLHGKPSTGTESTPRPSLPQCDLQLSKLRRSARKALPLNADCACWLIATAYWLPISSSLPATYHSAQQ